MQNRRDFLKSASMLVAGGLVAQNFTSCCPTASAKNIGLQLYSLRDFVKENGIQATLEVVAKMGYKNLEAAGYDNGKMYGVDPTELKKMIEDLGMKMTSSHTGQAYTKETEGEVMAWWDKCIETHNQLGVKYIIQPWLPVNDQTTLDDIKMYCDYFSTVGYKTASASIAFGYHNHDFEFRKIDDQIIYDFMLNNVSKNHVFFQADVYWIMKGGYNPVDYMRNYADQITVLHIKDEKEIGASGEMDFQAIFEQAKANNIRDWYVEVERYTNNNPVESVQQSFDYLNKAAYVY